MKPTRTILVSFCATLILGFSTGTILAETFELQHLSSPDEFYEYQHALIRNDTFYADSPQGNSDLLVGTKADTGIGDQGELRSILQFNLSPIASGIGSMPITEVSLYLRHLATGTGAPRIDGTPKVDVYAYDFSLIQEFATWNDPDGDGNPATGDTTPGGTLGAFIGTFGELDSANGIFDLNLDSSPAFVTAVENALAGDQFLRLILVEDEPDVVTRDIAFILGSTNRTPTTLPKITISTEDSVDLIGDYNGDGFVSAADYTTWRDNLGALIALPNEDPSATPGEVTAADFDVWKSRFGGSAEVGSGISATPVPEPSHLILVLAAAVLFLFSGQRRKFTSR